MSDAPLVPAADFIERHFPRASDKPRGRRSENALLQRLGVTVHHFGDVRLVDPNEVFEKIKSQPDAYANHRNRGRGRPPIAAE